MLKHLQPLPISEEMLGAYLEGNLSVEEIGYVEELLHTDANLYELAGELGDVNVDFINPDFNDSYLEYAYDVLRDFELPELNHLLDNEWEDTEVYNDVDFDCTCGEIETSVFDVTSHEMVLNDKNIEL